MAATGYTSPDGDPRKVNRDGDAMTGDLVLADSTPDTDRSATSRAYVLEQVAGAGTGVASGTVSAATSFGLPASAGTSATYSRGDHSHGTPPAPSGTATRTAETRITAGDVALASSPSWTIVSSGTTQLACSIPAAAGDRLHVTVQFMRTGSGFFLDMATLTSAGGISRFLGSGTATPLPEGNPGYYPQAASFPAATGPVQMILTAGEITADGRATVALVARGTGTQTIYASATYPWYVLLTNLGPVP
ncbi:hypothetical protein [Streptomyces fumanus]|uniref:hypothetical protein n=1 Tax=Streptomyces fumanus TaxID=67302 RepID=UPI0033FC0152